jgi:hypothetical protein
VFQALLSDEVRPQRQQEGQAVQALTRAFSEQQPEDEQYQHEQELLQQSQDEDWQQQQDGEQLQQMQVPAVCPPRPPLQQLQHELPSTPPAGTVCWRVISISIPVARLLPPHVAVLQFALQQMPTM